MIVNRRASWNLDGWVATRKYGLEKKEKLCKTKKKNRERKREKKRKNTPALGWGMKSGLKKIRMCVAPFPNKKKKSWSPIELYVNCTFNQHNVVKWVGSRVPGIRLHICCSWIGREGGKNITWLCSVNLTDLAFC